MEQQELTPWVRFVRALKIERKDIVQNLVVTVLGTIFLVLATYSLGLFIEVCK